MIIFLILCLILNTIDKNNNKNIQTRLNIGLILVIIYYISLIFTIFVQIYFCYHKSFNHLFVKFLTHFSLMKPAIKVNIKK